MRVRVLGEGPRTEFGNRCCASRPGTGEAVRPIDSSLRGNILDARSGFGWKAASSSLDAWLAWLPAMPCHLRAGQWASAVVRVLLRHAAVMPPPPPPPQYKGPEGIGLRESAFRSD